MAAASPAAPQSPSNGVRRPRALSRISSDPLNARGSVARRGALGAEPFVQQGARANADSARRPSRGTTAAGLGQRARTARSQAIADLILSIAMGASPPRKRGLENGEGRATSPLGVGRRVKQGVSACWRPA
jgi:hypothetical protein